jgi:hypothetical protein
LLRNSCVFIMHNERDDELRWREPGKRQIDFGTNLVAKWKLLRNSCVFIMHNERDDELRWREPGKRQCREGATTPAKLSTYCAS